MGKAFLEMAVSISKSTSGLLVAMAIVVILITGYFLLRRKKK
jgi:LPXTG-motif cell wall-anchored protein